MKNNLENNIDDQRRSPDFLDGDKHMPFSDEEMDALYLIRPDKTVKYLTIFNEKDAEEVCKTFFMRQYDLFNGISKMFFWLKKNMHVPLLLSALKNQLSEFYNELIFLPQERALHSENNFEQLFRRFDLLRWFSSSTLNFCIDSSVEVDEKAFFEHVAVQAKVAEKELQYAIDLEKRYTDMIICQDLDKELESTTRTNRKKIADTFFKNAESPVVHSVVFESVIADNYQVAQLLFNFLPADYEQTMIPYFRYFESSKFAQHVSERIMFDYLNHKILSPAELEEKILVKIQEKTAENIEGLLHADIEDSVRKYYAAPLI
ncbi:hypothetical protein COB57_03370 [Candidatus Peregrinibacteria bacterium]|nr:MAG: hypothetical protein COB57_03370 [Candidatus Peregrinibacteria bacterium]